MDWKWKQKCFYYISDFVYTVVLSFAHDVDVFVDGKKVKESRDSYL